MILTAITAITAAVGLAVAGTTAGQPIGDSLITSVDGYTLEPEGDGGLGTGSGPISAQELAELSGMDLSDAPDEMANAEGYVQMFTSDDGLSIALVIGVDVGASEARGFLAGFEGAAEAEGAEKVPLFPDETGALGDIEYHQLEMQGMSAAMVAFMAGDFGISAQVFEADDPQAVLAGMVRDQAALTPLTEGSASSADDGSDPAEEAGRIVGVLLLVGALVGIPTYLVTRSRRRRAASPAWPHQPPGWPPAAGYPQGPPPPGYAPPPGYGPGAGYPPGTEAPPAYPPSTGAPPGYSPGYPPGTEPPPPPSDSPESDGWSRPV